MPSDDQSRPLRHVPQAPVDADEQINPHAPIRRFIEEHWQKNVLIAVAIASLSISGCIVVSHTRAQNQAGYAFVVGEDGTVVYGKLRGLNPDSGVYKRFLKHVVRLRMQLTPDGLSDPEGAEAVFVDQARERLDRDVRKWTDQARANNMFTTPFITAYRKVAERGDSPVYEVKGYCMVTGVIGGLPVREKEPFVMTVQLAPNPKLDREEMIDAPFVVKQYFGFFNQREIDKERARQAAEEGR